MLGTVNIVKWSCVLNELQGSGKRVWLRQIEDNLQTTKQNRYLYPFFWYNRCHSNLTSSWKSTKTSTWSSFFSPIFFATFYDIIKLYHYKFCNILLVTSTQVGYLLFARHPLSVRVRADLNWKLYLNYKSLCSIGSRVLSSSSSSS